MKAMSIALVLILTLACATTAGAARYPFGIKGGIAWADFTGDGPWDTAVGNDDITYRNSFLVGFFMEFPLSSSFSVQPEVLYAGKGYKRVSPDAFPLYETDYKLNYVDIPVLLKYNLVFGASEPYFLFGPSINFLVSAEAVTGDSTVDLLDVDERDPYSNEYVEYSRMEFGMVAGFGLRMRGILLEGRYTFGLTDPIPDDGFKNQNSVASLLFGLTF